TEQEGNAASADDSIQVVQPMLDTRAFADGLKVEDVANEAESMAKPFARWHEPLHRVGKGDQADFVVVADGTESQDSSQLGRHIALLLPHGPERLASTGIDQQHDCQFPFLDKALDERMAHAGRDIPVDAA